MDVLKGEEVASSSWEESSSSSSEEEESDSAAAAYYGQRNTVTPRHPSMGAMQLASDAGDGREAPPHADDPSAGLGVPWRPASSS